MHFDSRTRIDRPTEASEFSRTDFCDPSLRNFDDTTVIVWDRSRIEPVQELLSRQRDPCTSRVLANLISSELCESRRLQTLADREMSFQVFWFKGFEGLFANPLKIQSRGDLSIPRNGNLRRILIPGIFSNLFTICLLDAHIHGEYFSVLKLKAP